MRKITFLLLFLTFNIVNAQSSWKKLDSENLSFRSNQLLERDTNPLKFDLFSLDLANFKKKLTLKSRGLNKTIELPNHKGEIINYQIIESSNFTEPVAKEYGLITSYNIISTKDKTETGKLTVGSNGINISLKSGNHSTLLINPYTKDNKTYISFLIENNNILEDNFSCKVKNEVESEFNERVSFNKRKSIPLNDGNLRTYKLALSCTGEYAQFHINQQGVSTGSTNEQKAAVLSAMNTSIARINGIFEREIGVKLEIVLISGDNPLIFLDPSRDNLTNDNTSTLLTENQSLCDNLIGTNNYDVGHILAADNPGGSGVAFLNSVCDRNFKAGGVTENITPSGDGFDIILAHEFGHQFGTPHTWNADAGVCDDSNRSQATAVEPGSGSTIMSYAGRCNDRFSNHNVQNRGDDYFHAVSLSLIWSFIETTSCANLTSTANNVPSADAGSDYTIPKLTPFALRGEANDTNNTGLTYTWEQTDNEPTIVPPSDISTSGPAFRSFPPISTPTRYVPKLETVLQGKTQSKWEVLPFFAREFNFAFVVRDNNLGGGGTSRDDVVVTVVNVLPFKVTAPSTAVSWNGATTQTITWDKSATDQAPINCQNVRIKLSTDGGLTFDTVLIDSTPNDGSQDVVIPNLPTTQARIMVEAVDNIFFNVNSTNFTIVDNPTASVEDFSFNNFSLFPNPSNGRFNISFDVLNTEEVKLRVFDFSGRLVENVAYKNVSNKFTTELDFEKLNSGLYLLQIENGNQQTTKKLIIK
ncbi:reprolysin-like metallopeptidase [Tenacibaculum sp. ZS6-P6]|uniref:zinc-dependent metalloprotease n=1 Tax=Tenacibaculum sp. ZS6-P6 TaxID=3447503 RepID=UPI003F96D4AF